MKENRFDAADMARRIGRSAGIASLGTLAPDGWPFVSFVTVATDVDGAPILLLSALAAHARHLAGEERASLLMQAPAGRGDDPLTGARITVIGRIRRVAQDDADQARLLARFLARHPEAERYAGFGDFSIHRMTMEGIHLVAGFGRIARLSSTDFLVPSSVVDAFAAAEAGLLVDLNNTGFPVVAIDPDGVDIADNGIRRLPFARRANDPGEVKPLVAGLD